MYKYRLISKKGEGTFSEVLKAQSIKSGKHVAIKCMKNHFDSIDQVNNLREIQALRRLVGHPNIIRLYEVLYDEPTGRLALVFELMDMNLYEAIKGRRHYLPEQKVKHYMYETLKAIDHMHRNGIFHRDVKPENLLLEDDVIKLADLGSCRGIYSRQPFTEYISTRWYRAPECLLTDGYYNFKMDLFAVGAVSFEIVALFPLFPGQDEMDQILKIHNVLGTPSEELLARKFKRNASHMDFNFPEKKGTGLERLIPHADPEVIELIKKLIKYDPDDRILARQALKDPFFRELRDAEKEAAAAVAPPAPRGGGGPSAQQELQSTSSQFVTTKSMAAAAMSASSSATGSSDHEGGGDRAPPESTHEPIGRENREEQNEDERTGGLPTIRQDKHKERTTKASSVAGSTVGAPKDDEIEDATEGTVLPPIGGLKGKRDSKAMKTLNFKTVGTSTLQKSGHVMGSATVHGHGSMLSPAHSHTHGGQAPRTLGVLGTSKGFSGTSGGASSSDPMASTNPHSWGAAAKEAEHRRAVSLGSAPNGQYNAPFGGKVSSKKR
eukprot:TRINITY_DN79969_c0_g1_i1.p1 TRINITY_DN79969_c0_g1~~TRINITY_DN79969_c0_g1_i1.p1  ORF type:complete len:551 (+),score=165.83 TRINITY_DN79969_c0_g1_i1:125-1777(+)